MRQLLGRSGCRVHGGSSCQTFCLCRQDTSTRNFSSLRMRSMLGCEYTGDWKGNAEKEQHSQRPAQPFLAGMIYPVAKKCGESQSLRNDCEITAKIGRNRSCGG